jgi:hypothetical protein
MTAAAQASSDPVTPSQPVDGPVTPLPEKGVVAVAARVPVAALIFGLLGWVYVAIEGYHAESRGMAASWIPVFPTIFGVVAIVIRNQRRRQGIDAVWGPLGWGFVWGLLAVLGLAGFYASLWRAL